MRNQASAVILVLWSLWGLPLLCVAGVVHHPCAPEVEQCHKTNTPDCAHPEPGCSHDGGCGHETGCGFDPCEGTIARSERLTDELPVLSYLSVAVAPSLPDLHAVMPAADRIPVYDNHPPSLPFHLSDVPLLI